MINEQLKEEIKGLYYSFFNSLDIDEYSGEFKNNSQKIKFATYPYIGDKYGNASKILIVGLDIGEDETSGYIQSLAERNNNLKDVHTDMNFHMGGTYFTALYLLKEELGYTEFYDRVKDKTIFNTIIKRYIKELPDENPLDYIAQTNFYKYVSIGRKGRKGNFDRKFIDKQKEVDLFINELEIFNPDIIFFQSTDFMSILNPDLLTTIKKDRRRIFVASHPSRSLPKLKYPEYYFKDYCREI